MGGLSLILSNGRSTLNYIALRASKTQSSFGHKIAPGGASSFLQKLFTEKGGKNKNGRVTSLVSLLMHLKHKHMPTVDWTKQEIHCEICTTLCPVKLLLIPLPAHSDLGKNSLCKLYKRFNGRMAEITTHLSELQIRGV